MTKINEGDVVSFGDAKGIVMCSAPRCSLIGRGLSVLVRWFHNDSIEEVRKSNLVVISPGGERAEKLGVELKQ